MNYKRVLKEGMHLRWIHVKKYVSVIQICYYDTPIAQGNYKEMSDLLNEIRENKSITTPVDLDFKPSTMKKRIDENNT